MEVVDELAEVSVMNQLAEVLAVVGHLIGLLAVDQLAEALLVVHQLAEVLAVAAVGRPVPPWQSAATRVPLEPLRREYTAGDAMVEKGSVFPVPNCGPFVPPHSIHGPDRVASSHVLDGPVARVHLSWVISSSPAARLSSNKSLQKTEEKSQDKGGRLLCVER